MIAPFVPYLLWVSTTIILINYMCSPAKGHILETFLPTWPPHSVPLCETLDVLSQKKSSPSSFPSGQVTRYVCDRPPHRSPWPRSRASWWPSQASASSSSPTCAGFRYAAVWPPSWCSTAVSRGSVVGMSALRSWRGDARCVVVSWGSFGNFQSANFMGSVKICTKPSCKCNIHLNFFVSFFLFFFFALAEGANCQTAKVCQF